jgi:O-antigen/teichoic acid export membrane protein
MKAAMLGSTLRVWLCRLLPKAGVLHTFVGLVGTVAVQGVYFVVLARVMGPSALGVLSAGMALVYLFVPFGLWGAGGVLMAAVARGEAPVLAAFSRGLLTWAMAATTMSVLAVVALRLALPDLPLASAVLLATTEVGAGRLVELVVQSFQARKRMACMGGAQALAAAVKVAGITLFVLQGQAPELVRWLGFYAVASWLGAACCLLWFLADLGWPRLPLPRRPTALKAGFLFSLSLFSQGAYNDVDKAVLDRCAGGWETGQYAVAYRVLMLAFTPVNAVLHASYSGFFKAGAGGLRGTRAFAWGLRGQALKALGLSLVLAAAGFWMLPIVLGPAYGQASWILAGLIPLLMFRTTHYLFSNALTGADRQGTRILCQGTVALLNFGLCLWWIPLWGMHGAVAASLASDGLLALATAAAFRTLCLREARAC